MIVTLTNIIGLLIAAIAVAMIARRLRLPYTVGLVVAGLILARLRIGGSVVLTHDFVFDLILPPLLFEAAINIHWKQLRRDTLPVLTLAITSDAMPMSFSHDRPLTSRISLSLRASAIHSRRSV